jgi:hypothetical protein
MADERDEQATQVGHQVIGDGADAAPVGGADAAQAGEATTAGPTEAAGGATAADSGGATEVFFSRDQAQEQQGADAPPTPPRPSSEPSGGGTSPAAADRIAADQQDSFAQNPLPYVGGAFVGAFVFAQILKRITGGGD